MTVSRFEQREHAAYGVCVFLVAAFVALGVEEHKHFDAQARGGFQNEVFSHREHFHSEVVAGIPQKSCVGRKEEKHGTSVNKYVVETYFQLSLSAHYQYDATAFQTQGCCSELVQVCIAEPKTVRIAVKKRAI